MVCFLCVRTRRLTTLGFSWYFVTRIHRYVLLYAAIRYDGSIAVVFLCRRAIDFARWITPSSVWATYILYIAYYIE